MLFDDSHEISDDLSMRERHLLFVNCLFKFPHKEKDFLLLIPTSTKIHFLLMLI